MFCVYMHYFYICLINIYLSFTLILQTAMYLMHSLWNIGQLRKLSFTFPLVQWISFRGNFEISQRMFWQWLEIFLIVTMHGKGCYWPLVGRIKGCWKALDSHPQQLPHPKHQQCCTIRNTALVDPSCPAGAV